MGPIARWLTIAVVIGVLALLTVALYLILEPLHRDDGDDARAIVPVGYTIPTVGGTANRAARSGRGGEIVPHTTVRRDSVAAPRNERGKPRADRQPRHEREKAQRRP